MLETEMMGAKMGNYFWQVSHKKSMREEELFYGQDGQCSVE